MTLFARDIDTGMAKWVYQMTPHDEWDYDGVNENILVDMEVDGEMRKALVHFDRNGFAYTLDRETGELLVAEKYDPAVNWATHVDMETGRPQVVSRYSTDHNGEDVNTTNICPAALGTKDQQPAAYSPRDRPVLRSDQPRLHGLRALPGLVHRRPGLCRRDGRHVSGAGRHATSATSSPGTPTRARSSGSTPSRSRSGRARSATAGDVVFYGTLEGYLKAVDANTRPELYRFKTPSGIIGNVNTWMHNGKQYVGVLSGVGGWAGIGLAAGLIAGRERGRPGTARSTRAARPATKVVDTAGLGAVGAYKSLSNYTQLGGQLTVFTLPTDLTAVCGAGPGALGRRAVLCMRSRCP